MLSRLMKWMQQNIEVESDELFKYKSGLVKVGKQQRGLSWVKGDQEDEAESQLRKSKMRLNV